MFIPYRTNLSLNQTPVISILFCLLAIFVMSEQKHNYAEIDRFAEHYCVSHPHQAMLASLNAYHVSKRSLNCKNLFSSIHKAFVPASKINWLSVPSTTMDAESSLALIGHFRDSINAAYAEFQLLAPENISRSFSYLPGDNNTATMLSSAFAHTGWLHLIGNLFFFLVFAIAIEGMAGHLALWFSVVTLSVSCNVFYMLAVYAEPAPLPTLGLSGVIMGLMTMLVFFYPNTRIRFLAIFMPFWRPTAPVWLVALGFVSWDGYQLIAHAGADGTNLVSHLSGAALGYALGLIAFSGKRRRLRLKAVETLDRQIVIRESEAS